VRAAFRLLGALLLLSVGPAVAFGQPERRDHEIFKDVASQIERYPRFTVFDNVEIGVDSGAVTLVGRVTMGFKIKEIERLVSRVDGVVSVRNEIKALPASVFDDNLRYRAARAIYRHPGFWPYAAMAQPPIHIVVENGQITLTGVVHSNVERMMAQSIVSSIGGFSVTNKLRTDAEVRAELERLR
jgi:hyperosmotically inducible protein